MNHHAVSQFMMGRWGQILAIALIVVMSLVLIFQLTSVYTLFFGKGPLLEVEQTIRASRQAPEDYLRIIDHHLFGNFIPQNIDGDDVPKTLLDLKLIGVMLSIPSRYSQAIIKIPGGQEKVYREDDKVPGNARIVKILKNKVIIRRANGRMESLSLPQEKLIFHQSPKPMEMHND